MIRAHAVEDVRAAEEKVMARLPEGALMQRAAAGLAAACVGELRRHGLDVYASRVVLLVGAGNNGGDALYAGARLARRGARVDALLLGPAAHPGGLRALVSAGGRVHRCESSSSEDSTGMDEPGAPGLDGRATEALGAAELVVDGLVGLSGRAGLRGAAAAVRDRLPAQAPVVAVDLPSGVEPASGETPGAHVRAGLTVTFGTAKPCLLLPPASRAAGRVRVVDLGLGGHLPEAAVERLEPSDVPALWPSPTPGDHKYSRGVVGVVAGSPTYTGAAVLAVGAAVRSGAGMVRYLGPAHPTELVRQAWPEAVPGPGRVQAWVLGPGVDPEAGDGQREQVRQALASGLPCLVDAGALALLPSRVGDDVLLTPHAGELARLLSGRGEQVEREQVEQRPLHFARRAAELTGATVLLKGSTTLVVSPGGQVRSQADAPPQLATAGAGDVLAGIAGALLASGMAALDAGSLAALVHGTAAARASAGGPIRAGDVVDALPGTLSSLLRP